MRLHEVIILFIALVWTSRIVPVKGFKFVPEQREVVYEYVGSVIVEAQAPWDEINQKSPPLPTGWKVRGTFKLQRIDANTLAAALVVEKITIDKANGGAAVYYQNKEMQSLYNPFQIVYTGDTISRLLFKRHDSVWSKNFKRAMASALQVQGSAIGAFVVKEPTIHGVCSTEYYVSSKPNGHLSVRKSPELNTCNPFVGGIHMHRRNVPEMRCDADLEKNVIVGSEAIYDLAPLTNSTTKFYLNDCKIEGTTLLQTFESTGESQFIVSNLKLTHVSENEILNIIDVSSDICDDAVSIGHCDVQTEEHSNDDYTGGRQALNSNELIRMATDSLSVLADSLEDAELKFDEPYESRVVQVIRIVGRCDYASLKKMYEIVNTGTSYHQETVRNLFFEIIPRVGTKAAILLTRDLVVKNLCKPTTSILLLTTMPFHISEMSSELVSECEVLMSLGSERPDVRLVGILSFSTIVYQGYATGKIEKSSFEKYVKKYFDLFLGSYDYEQKMLYMQGLRNLKLGNVVEYLDPIIRDRSQSDDIRFLAMFITMETAWRRDDTDKNFETFWPIFENRSEALELRVAAFTTLLTSYPTPARLMSIHALIETETDPHLINFYRTTILSLAGSTQPCYRKLRRLTSYMIRHLPQAPSKRYFVTGNYIYDYRSEEFGMGASIQALLIGNNKTHSPYIGFFKLEQEALGKYTDQYTLYVKARGIDEVITDKLFKAATTDGGTITLTKLRQMLSTLKMPTIQKVPVHLEIIIQFEGKSVLIMYINQNTFNELTGGDVMKRITKLLQTDSHINWQDLRWSFFTRYSIPTVLGTPSSMTIQSTSLYSIRGNITKTNDASTIHRNHQIDVRHSSFAVVTSKSYNPFLNLEHSINREQGFLAFLPVNSEILFNWTNTSIWFSLFRPNNLMSGVSLKSRTLTITTGRILRNSDTVYHDLIISEGDPHLVASKLIDYEIKDLGLTVTAVSHPFDIMSHLKLMSDLDPTVNMVVEKNDANIKFLLDLWSLIRLNNNHIGTNKKFKLLFHNTRNTKLEGRFKISYDQTDGESNNAKVSEKENCRFDIGFQHKSDDEILHNLDVVVKVNNFHNSKKLQLVSYIEHTDTRKRQWRMCSEATYQPIVFLVEPYSLSGLIQFGESNRTDKDCSKTTSKIAFEIYGNVLPEGRAVYKRNSKSSCPRELLKFDPPVQNKCCNRNEFQQLTKINEFGLNFTFENSPQWLENSLNRMDHFVTAFSQQIHMHNFKDGIEATINTLTDKLELTGSLNGQNFAFPNVPLWLSTNIDAKFDTLTQLSFDWGFMHMCSIVSGVVNTFDDISINLIDHSKGNLSVLLLADCSIRPRFALFVNPKQTIDGKEIFTIELHVDDDVVTYAPRADQSDWISVNGQLEIQVITEILPIENKLKVLRNAEDLLIFEILEAVQIQYYRGNILTVNIPASIKGNLCGICSLPYNEANVYHV